MSKKRPRRKQNMLSGTAFGLALVLVVAGALYIVKQDTPNLQQGAVAGYVTYSDPDRAMAAAAPAPAPADMTPAGAPVEERPASVDQPLDREPDPATATPIIAPEPDPAAVQTAERTLGTAPNEDATAAVSVTPEPLMLAPAEDGADLLAPTEVVAPSEDLSLGAPQPAGPVPTARKLDVGEVLGLLRSRGFDGFTAVSQRGDLFVFQARQGGRPVQVTVDSTTGAVIGVQ